MTTNRDELIELLTPLAQDNRNNPDVVVKAAAGVLYALLAALSSPAPEHETRLLMNETARYSEGFIKRATAHRN